MVIEEIQDAVAAEPEWLEALRRDSRIGLDAEGRFSYRGRPLENERVEALFHRGLSVRADGEVILRVGAQWCYVQVQDVPFFVDALRGASAGSVGSGQGTVMVRLRSGAEEAFEPERLQWCGDSLVYYDLAHGARARLSRWAVLDLSELLVECPSAPGGIGIRYRGEVVPLRGADDR